MTGQVPNDNVQTRNARRHRVIENQRLVPPDSIFRRTNASRIVHHIREVNSRLLITHADGEASVFTTTHTPTSLTRLGWSLTTNRNRSSDTCGVSQHHVNSDITTTNDIATTNDDMIKGINTS